MAELRSKLLEALERLERRAESAASGWRLMPYAVILAPVALVAVEATAYHDITAIPEPLWIALSVSSLATGASLWYGWRLRSGVRQALEVSVLAHRIAAGEVPIEAFRSAQLWPWYARNISTESLDTILRTVAHDLDWFLGYERARLRGQPPPRIFRAS